jgi:beta-lactamase superfamily II metal-dependent hydrolase
MSVIRTFHPIGQGAFYSEIHSHEGEEFTIVYDCGSNAPKKLEKKIKSVFPQGHKIDILFISHFHKDHINGIDFLKKYCKIKKVVIPFLDDEAKALVKIANVIDSGYSEIELIDNPNGFFGKDVSVIIIDQIDPSETTQNDNNLEDTIDISKMNEKTYKSGTNFTLSTTAIPWFFIPFNYKHDERKEQFKIELSRYTLTLANLDTVSKILTNKPNIVKAYNNVDGDLNKNSMALFSGPKTNDQISSFQCSHCFCRHHCHFRFRLYFESGCLYMGDIDLKEPNLVNDLKSKLNSVIPYIGTLQIPHHGSIKNFDKSILCKNIHCAIFSYGTKNTYGHPSDKVINDIIISGIYPYLVTEEQHSMVTQWK